MSQSSITKTLNKIDFYYGCTIEIILTTWGPNRTINAAPMGVVRNNQDQILIKPYKSSNTYTNLMNTREACINITLDPDIFLKTTFKEEELGRLPIKKGSLSIPKADVSIPLKIMQSMNISRFRVC